MGLSSVLTADSPALGPELLFALQQVYQVPAGPSLVCYLGGNGRGLLERLVDAAEVVVEAVQGDGVPVIAELLGECVGHPHRPKAIELRPTRRVRWGRQDVDLARRAGLIPASVSLATCLYTYSTRPASGRRADRGFRANHYRVFDRRASAMPFWASGGTAG